MPTALVVRTQRHKKIGDSSSPMVYTLKRKPQDAKIFDLARIAQDIEALGANTLRLVNDSNATTKGGANNLIFELVTADKDSTGGGSGGNNPDGGGSDGDQGENPLG